MTKTSYICDKCQEKVEKQEDLIVIERVPEIIDVYPRSGKGNQIVGAKFQSLGFDKQELCQHCYNRYMELYNSYMSKLADDWQNK